MKVFFDASVIIAALLSPTGGSAKVFRFVKLGLIKGISSQTVIEEVLEEKHLPKIKKTEEEIVKFIASSDLVIRKTVTDDEIHPYQNLVHIEDAHLIAGANLTKCKYLLTLDKKHLLHSEIKEKFLPLSIVSPKELLEEIATNY